MHIGHHDHIADFHVFPRFLSPVTRLSANEITQTRTNQTLALFCALFHQPVVQREPNNKQSKCAFIPYNDKDNKYTDLFENSLKNLSG